MRTPRGIAVQPRSYAKVERAAALARRTLAPDAPVVSRIDAIRLFERGLEENGHLVTGGAKVEARVQNLPSEIEAYTCYAGSTGYVLSISERTYAQIRRGDPRGVSTLYHELGHLALHRRELQQLTKLPHRELSLERGSSTHRFCADSEWQADSFAAALAIPAPALDLAEEEGWLREDAIRGMFRTSHRMTEIRVRNFRQRGAELRAAWQ
jgi:hypothetical protein